jgi:hypothetical protein
MIITIRMATKKAFRKRILKEQKALDMLYFNNQTPQSAEMYLDLYRKIIKEEVEKRAEGDGQILKCCLEEFIWYDNLEKSYYMNLNNPLKIEYKKVLESIEDECQERRRADGEGND